MHGLEQKRAPQQLPAPSGHPAWQIAAILLAVVNVAHADERDTVEVLDTPSFIVKIELKCQDGGGCDDALYTGTNKKTGKTMFLSGAPDYGLCADGVTPCQWIGYKFKSGAYTYSVSLQGVLRVERRGKLILHEEGKWRN